MRVILGAAGAAACLIGSPAGARILATCGVTHGQAYYLGQPSGWQSDAISSGRFVFTSDGSKNPNVLFKDVRGAVTNAARSGARISFSLYPDAAREFAIVVIYPDDRITETYTIVTEARGKKRKLLWTTSKIHGLGFVAKVGAYTADCD